MMGRIYSEAELVMAWLGTATRYAAQWVRALNTIPAWNDDDHGNFKRWYKVYALSILNLCNSPYWNRLWIVQEYTLAQRVTIQCGVHRTGDENLEWFFENWGFVSQYIRVKKRPSFYHTLARKVVTSRRHTEKDKKVWHLGTLVSWFTDSECMDPRDRIYGLLALCDPLELAESSITPDYSKSVLELYTQLVRMIVGRRYYDGGWGALYTVNVIPLALRIGKPESNDLDPDTRRIVKSYRELTDGENSANV